MCGLYKGKGKPLRLHAGRHTIGGYKSQTKKGEEVIFSGTYNDSAQAVIEGGVKEENPRVNLVPENRRKFEGWTAFTGVSVTLTQNQAVPEWETAQATRVRITGGTGQLKYYLSVVSAPARGAFYTVQMLIRNIGSAPLVLNSNLGLRVKEVLPGETARYYETGIEGEGVSNLQIRFQAAPGRESEALDFLAFGPVVFREDKSPQSPFRLAGVLPEAAVSGENLIPLGRQSFEGWVAYQGAVVSLMQGREVPEWNTSFATGITATGGGSSLKYYHSIGIPAAGEQFTLGVRVKNTGSNPMRVHTNLGNREAVVLPGASLAFCEAGIQGTGSIAVQLQFHTLQGRQADSLAFLAWQPQIFQEYTGPGGRGHQITALPAIAPLWQLPSGKKDSYNTRTGEIVRHAACITLSGTENWWYDSNCFMMGVNELYAPANSTVMALCSHFPVYAWNELRALAGATGFSRSASALCVKWEGKSNVSEFKAWLAAQSAAGTPVTVIYEKGAEDIERTERKEIPVFYKDTLLSLKGTGSMEAAFTCRVREG